MVFFLSCSFSLRFSHCEVKCLTLWDPMVCPWNSPGQSTGVGSLSLLQGIFPTQGSNPGLPHCRQILYQLSHKGRPRTLELVAYSFLSGSSQPRNRETQGLPRCRQILYQLSYQRSPGLVYKKTIF